MKFVLDSPTTNFFLWIFLIGLLITACSPAPQVDPQAVAEPAILLNDCQLSTPGVSRRIPARCGSLSVPENPAEPAGRTLQLHVAVLPAVSRNPAGDPLLFLTGGPGQAATESYPLISFAFDRINQKRDIVLVDQRGTGQSNPIDCAEPESSPDTPEALELSLRACLDSFQGDARFYTTDIAVQDLERVRLALGYSQFNIYGLSYGTRTALQYLRRYPERVRTMMVDGIVPPQEILGLDIARDAQRALEITFQRCAADPDCQAAFPELETDFQTVLSVLSENPVTVSLPHPLTGEATEVEFDGESFGVAIRLLSYQQETVALIPLLVHTAAADSDYRLLAAQYLVVAGELTETISQGMGFSVLCSEDAPFLKPQEIEAANRDTYLQNQQTDELFRVCEIWPKGEIPSDYKTPLVSSVPTLILSGEADPVTPPENGELLLQSFSSGRHLIAPGQGHNVIIRGCLPRLAAEFVESADQAALDAGCVEAIQPAPFFVTFVGPTP